MIKKAFTLAEVLITLAIIGVVAAITIPGIVANHQKTALETQFAKSYRTFQTAVNLAIAEHGGIETWDWQEKYTDAQENEFVQKYFLPYLNVAKFCPAGQNAYECFPDTYYKYINGNLSIFNYAAVADLPKALLADGSSVRFFFQSNCMANKDRCMSITVDTNGFKKPNVFGRDFFWFNFYPQTGEFLPEGVNRNATYDEESGSYTKFTPEEVLSTCHENGNGSNCAARIVSEGFKMNY